MVTEVEYFDVLFSKHLTQKAKTWEDGFLEYHIKGNKVREPDTSNITLDRSI
jgi:hypothetical protein